MLINVAILALYGPALGPISDVLVARGFEIDRWPSIPWDHYYRYRHPATGSWIYISWGPHGGDPARAMESWRSSLNARLKAPRTGAPSGLPLAAMVEYSVGHSVSNPFASRDTFGTFRTKVFPYKVPTGTESRGYEQKDIPEVMEGLFRWIIGTETGGRFKMGKIEREGREFFAYQDEFSKWHVEAKEWAAMRGWKLTENRLQARVQFATPQGSLLLVVGADKVKLGQTWHELAMPVSARGREILLPPEVRELIPLTESVDPSPKPLFPTPEVITPTEEMVDPKSRLEFRITKAIAGIATAVIVTVAYIVWLRRTRKP